MASIDVDEVLERLAPVLGKAKTEAYWMAYLAAQPGERRRIEAMLQMIAARDLGLLPGSDTLYLAPPDKGLATMGTFEVGTLTCNRRPLGPLRLTLHDMNQHTLVAGRSGSGKTTAVFRLLRSAHENGLKFIVLDWKNEYRSLIRHPEFGANTRVYTVGRSSVVPLQYNPLIPPAHVSPSTHLKHTIDHIQSAYFLGEGVAHILQVGIDALYREFKVYSPNPEGYPTFKDLREWLRAYKPRNQREAGWMSSTQRALDSLCFGEMGQVVVTETPLPIGELLAHHTIVEMDVSSADKSFIVQSLLWNIYAHQAGRQQNDFAMSNIVVLEEAHNVLRKSSASAKETVVELLMRQARSRGLGMIVVDQTISLLSPAVLSNIHNLFLLSQPHSAVAAKMLSLPGDTEDYLSRLEVGEAIGKIQSRIQGPFTLRFPLEGCKEEFVADEDVRGHMRACLSDPGPNSPPMATGNLSRPDESGDEIGKSEQELLKSIWEHPYNGTVKKYRRLGVSRRKGQIMRQRLLDQGLVKRVPCLVPEGQIVLMEVTAKGRRLLHSIGTDVSRYNPREGGAAHRYWCERVAEKYRLNGYVVEKEVRRGDRIIDVVARKPGSSTIGIEVERSGDTYDVIEFEL